MFVYHERLKERLETIPQRAPQVAERANTVCNKWNKKNVPWVFSTFINFQKEFSLQNKENK